MKSFIIISFYSITLLAALNFTCIPSFASSSIGVENAMCFHKAVTDSNKKPVQGYELAGRLFPDADLYSWASNTLIKKLPDLTFYKSDIDSITIVRPPYVPPDSLSLNIRIKFIESAAQKLSDYTIKNKKKHVALTVGRKYQSIAMIHDKIQGEMVLTSAEKTVEQLRDQFTAISDDVVFIDMHRN